MEFPQKICSVLFRCPASQKMCTSVFTGNRKANENQNIHCMMKSALARFVWNQNPVSAHEFNDDWLAIVYLLSGVVRMYHVLFQCVCKCVSTVTFTSDMKHLRRKVLIKYNRTGRFRSRASSTDVSSFAIVLDPSLTLAKLKGKWDVVLKRCLKKICCFKVKMHTNKL